MALIKAQSASTLLKEAIVLDLGDLGRQAAKLQAAMEIKAKKIIADADAEAAKMTQDSRNKGFDEGRAEGLAKGIVEGRAQGQVEAMKLAATQFKQLETQWLEAVRQWETNRDTVMREGPERVLELALRLAEKLVHRVIEVDPSVVVDQVATALAHVMKELEVTVRINPKDRPTLDAAMPQLVAEFSHLKNIRLVDDAEITAGGCVLVYGQGQIDSTIDTQLRRVVELMLPEESDRTA